MYVHSDGQYVARIYAILPLHANMPLFELQACVGNYQTTNTKIVANDPTLCKNKGRYYFHSNNKHTLFSQKNKVSLGFLNIISGWRSIRLTPAFSVPQLVKFGRVVFFRYVSGETERQTDTHARHNTWKGEVISYSGGGFNEYGEVTVHW